MDFRAEYEKWCTDPYFDEATKASGFTLIWFRASTRFVMASLTIQDV